MTSADDTAEPVDQTLAAQDTYWPDNAASIRIEADLENCESEESAPYMTMTIAIPGQDGVSMTHDAGGRTEMLALSIDQARELALALHAAIRHLER